MTEDIDELSPRRISQRRVAISVSLPMSLVNIIDAIGESERLPQATLIERIIRKGLAVERSEREALVHAKDA